MRQYLLKRLLQVIPTVLGTTIIVFILINAAPGDPLSGLIDPTISGEDLANRREQLGLNRPIHMRYLTWIGELVLEGNLGYSTRYRRSVGEMIATRVGPTLLLTLPAMLLSLLVAVPIGVYSATKQYSKLDFFFIVMAVLGVSIPVFFLGVVMIKIVSFDLRLLPVGNMVTAGLYHESWFHYAKDVLRHLILPLSVLCCAQTATFVRYTRSSMLEVIRQDYVRTARAKGLSERVVIYKHALRNGIIPVITVLGLSLPFLFSGAVITETVFSWPGMGTLTILAVESRDYPLLMGITLVIAFMVILGNLLADIFYAVADPRIRFD